MLEQLNETYVSTDVEADGPIPGPHSMLSLGSAAYLADKTLLSTFTVNLETLPDAAGDPTTMGWWLEHPEAWAACRKDPEDPQTAMQRYCDWLACLPGTPVFVGYPAAYDFMFVQWYLHRFTGQQPFARSALDIKTLAMAVMKRPYTETDKASMPEAWFEMLPHKHEALDDALEQGTLFCNLLAELAKA